jgi:hypothetical protein
MIANSTVSGNTAAGRGGDILIQSVVDAKSGAFVFTVRVDLTFSTMYGNTAYSGGDIAIEDVTCHSFGNYKVTTQVSRVRIRNRIVVEDPAHPGPHIVGILTSDSHNLFQNTSSPNIVPATSTLHRTEKLLSVNDFNRLFASPVELRDNGGSTKTLVLFPSTNNPAFNKVPLDASHFNGTTTDQRGDSQPDGSEDTCDIGACESSF